MLSLLISLILSTGSAESEPVAAFKALRLEQPDLFVAPKLPPFPRDLKGKILRVPKFGRCLTLDGEDMGDGAFMPRAWGEAIDARLEAAGMLQPKAQALLDSISRLALVGMSANGEAVAADAAADAAEARLEVGTPAWKVVAYVVAALAAGAGAGIIYDRATR